MNRRLSRPRWPLLLAWVDALLILLAVSIATRGSNSMHTPVRAVIGSAAICGGLALVVTGVVAVASQRRVVAVDVFRIVCWVVIGVCAGLALGVPPRTYFQYVNGYYPSWVAPLEALAAIGVFVAVVCILASLWLFPVPGSFPPGRCARCGYSLTGNVSGVCPECGERI